jgi:hypothetical protein
MVRGVLALVAAQQRNTEVCLATGGAGFQALTRSLLHDLGSLIAASNELSVMRRAGSIGNGQVDETVLAGRLKYRGRHQRPQRLGGPLWASAVIAFNQAERRVEFVAARLMVNRGSAECNELAERLGAIMALFVADGLASYHSLGRRQRFHLERVNHSLRLWTNPRGFSTNAIEGTFGELKRLIRRMFRRVGAADAATTNHRLQLAVFIFNQRAARRAIASSLMRVLFRNESAATLRASADWRAAQLHEQSAQRRVDDFERAHGARTAESERTQRELLGAEQQLQVQQRNARLATAGQRARDAAAAVAPVAAPALAAGPAPALAAPAVVPPAAIPSKQRQASLLRPRICGRFVKAVVLVPAASGAASSLPSSPLAPPLASQHRQEQLRQQQQLREQLDAVTRGLLGLPAPSSAMTSAAPAAHGAVVAHRSRLELSQPAPTVASSFSSQSAQQSSFNSPAYDDVKDDDTPCGVCHRTMMQHEHLRQFLASIKCSRCKLWVHYECNGLRPLPRYNSDDDRHFWCPRGCLGDDRFIVSYGQRVDVIAYAQRLAREEVEYMANIRHLLRTAPYASEQPVVFVPSEFADLLQQMAARLQALLDEEEEENNNNNDSESDDEWNRHRLKNKKRQKKAEKREKRKKKK